MSSRRRMGRRSRSSSRSKDREVRERKRRSRSRSRGKYRHSPDRSNDLYGDLISQDLHEDSKYSRSRYEDRSRRYDERRRSRDYDRDKDRNRVDRDRRERYTNRYSDNSADDYDSENPSENISYSNQEPNNTIIIRYLAQHITEADAGKLTLVSCAKGRKIRSDLIQCGLNVASIRLLRKLKIGASRGFAFVEFNSVEEAKSWMDYKQGILILQDQTRAIMHYSNSKETQIKMERVLTDWYCAKCGVFNFKRRFNCFKCCASREESEKGGEGSDEVSSILTKKIMLRNLDALTNEESVLTIMQEFVPNQVAKITKILICRDPLTQTSRGICYLNFDNLVDSMNTHNALKALDPPLTIDGREVLITYCMDTENRHVIKPSTSSKPQSYIMDEASSANHTETNYQYTLSDVSRLAEYSASLYATSSAQHETYLQYYTQYYTNEITNGHYDNLPSVQQLGCATANSGAAVALNAIQRQKKKLNSIETTATAMAQAVAAAAAINVDIPKGDDGKIYPTPNVSMYQYDDTSGYYYDPTTGLYYDAHSQYYYNNESGCYLYWNPEKNTYSLAHGTNSSETVNISAVIETAVNTDVKLEEKKEKPKEIKQDKVKVAKKIVKDMEKWAKQLNQKKDMTYIAPIVATGTGSSLKQDEIVQFVPKHGNSSGYADVGFSILEKKEKSKLSDLVTPGVVKVSSPYIGSDSDDDLSSNKAVRNEQNESDYVDFQKLTCLLCKRAFQSLDILTKHLKMSNLHKENLQKYKLTKTLNDNEDSIASAISYRDRAKERRQKYGESDPPPPNRSKERFEKEIQKASSSSMSSATPMPIGQNNVGNRLLQKMGWSEGQGLGRSNQGRTSIIEADARSSTAGLGSKTSAFGPGEDYKSYMKKMMKSRYEQAN